MYRLIFNEQRIIIDNQLWQEVTNQLSSYKGKRPTDIFIQYTIKLNEAMISYSKNIDITFLLKAVV